MTAASDAVRFPTSETSHPNQHADYRDPTVTRAALQAHDAVDRVASSVGPVVDKVKDAAAKASSLLYTNDTRISDVQEQSLAALRIAVRKRPATSVAIALALGWMMARAVSR